MSNIHLVFLPDGNGSVSMNVNGINYTTSYQMYVYHCQRLAIKPIPKPDPVLGIREIAIYTDFYHRSTVTLWNGQVHPYTYFPVPNYQYMEMFNNIDNFVILLNDPTGPYSFCKNANISCAPY